MQWPAHEEGAQLWQGRFVTGLISWGCAGCWPGAELGQAALAGSRLWQLYQVTGFIWEPDLLESGAVQGEPILPRDQQGPLGTPRQGEDRAQSWQGPIHRALLDVPTAHVALACLFWKIPVEKSSPLRG